MKGDLFDILKELIINNGSEFEECVGEEIVYTKIKPNKRDLAGATMYSEHNMYMGYEIYAWNADNEPSDEMIHISVM